MSKLTSMVNSDHYDEKFKKFYLTLLQQDHSAILSDYSYTTNEMARLSAKPLGIATFSNFLDPGKTSEDAIIATLSGSQLLTRVLSTLPYNELRPGTHVGVHRHSNAIVKILPREADSTIKVLKDTGKPDITYSDIGGLDSQKQEIREAVELPLNEKHLYLNLGIEPPSGVLLYGPPGTGKTLLAKAVAHHTSAAFIHMVGSEFVQKWLGEGARLVRDVFMMARQNAPAIIFIDEIDSIASKRFDAQTGADREVQRILLQLLTEMDGFDSHTNVKVIMATNRPDTLDPALLRPGRLDRKIHFPIPDKRHRRLIYQVYLSKMNISDDLDIEDFIHRPEQLSGADIAAICQESGMIAIRSNRYVILPQDLTEAYDRVARQRKQQLDFYQW